MMLAALLAAFGASADPALKPVPWQTQAAYGATHAVEFTAADFTNTAANAAQAFTFTLAGPCQYRFAAAILDAPFDSRGNTNAAASAVTVTVGGAAAVSAAPVCADAAPPQNAWAPASWAYYALTNGAAAAQTVSFGAPGAGIALADLESGRLTVYLHILRR
jgi:hypothetical protein